MLKDRQSWVSVSYLCHCIGVSVLVTVAQKYLHVGIVQKIDLRSKSRHNKGLHFAILVCVDGSALISATTIKWTMHTTWSYVMLLAMLCIDLGCGMEVLSQPKLSTVQLEICNQCKKIGNDSTHLFFANILCRIKICFSWMRSWLLAKNPTRSLELVGPTLPTNSTQKEYAQHRENTNTAYIYGLLCSKHCILPQEKHDNSVGTGDRNKQTKEKPVETN